MGWGEVQDAIQQAIVTASGLAASRVIWGFQDTNQPALSYVSINVPVLMTIGLDWLEKIVLPDWIATHAYAVGAEIVNDSLKRYQCITAGTSAASGGPTGTGANITDGTVHWKYAGAVQEIKAVVRGVRETSIELQCFSAATASADEALFMAEQIRTGLLLPSVRSGLAAVGVSPFDPGPANYAPAVVNVGFRGRATCSIRCYVPAQALAEYYGFIQTVNGKIRYTGGAFPGTTEVDFTADLEPED